jgi:molecular chaperone DnaK (HSP70)
MSEFNNLCLGIDFGTTNSCISIWYKNKSIIIPDIDGSEIIPTVIEINIDKKIIGREAYLRKEIFNSNEQTSSNNIFLIYEIKKLLGKKYSELDKKFIDILAFSIGSDSDDNILILDLDNNKSYYPDEIATHLFMSFKLRAETYLTKKFGQIITISNSVVTIPAYFNKNQRQTIKNCAEYAGLNVIRLINEPTAAAICYGLGLGSSTNSDNLNIIVYDFGGGTLDVSLLNISDEVYEVLGSCGNNNLGGSDFDAKIMEYIIQEFIIKNSIDYDEFIENVTENSLHKLKLLSEQAKIALSDNTNTKIKINNFYTHADTQIDLAISLSREKFNEIVQNLIRLIIKPLDELLNLCSIDKNDINEIIMVGGMTRMPIIRHNVELFFNKDVNCSINPDNVVSIGSAIHGYMLSNNTNLEDKLLLIDRTALSIGVETSGGIMDVIIPRGTIIPVKKTKKYSNDSDYVDSIDIKIFEGERKFTKDNFLIGNFTLNGIEKQKKGLASILITFSIDSDGIIKIKAEDLDNPLNKKSIQVSGNKQNLSKEQINDIIENAKLMNNIDKIDKIKKESYQTITENCKKILDNLSSDLIKIPEDIKQVIITNVKDILEWIQSLDYTEIDVDKYKEILHDFKTSYSIYIIQQSDPVIEFEASNKKDDDEKCIEIYDDEMNTKKYEEQINYFRQIVDEYDKINKQIKITKNTNQIDENIYEELEQLFNYVYNFASEKLIDFFINKNLSDEIVQNSINELFILDSNFKEKYNLFADSFDLVNKLINLLESKEQYYLNLLEQNENIEQNEQINLINEKLDLIIDFQAVIYKINSGYAETDINKLENIYNLVEKL